MTTYYVDPENGNDANNGLSWGTAYKTLLNGPTFARLGQTDSDEIRIAKSPDPVSIGDVTWTLGSNIITFGSCSNRTIDNCDGGWSAGLITPTYPSSTTRQGTASMQVVLSSTNGKVCYKAFASTDLSIFSRITFWVNFGTAVNYSASNPVYIDLCSDTAGATPVNSFNLPRYYYPANYWVPITIDYSAPLGSAIQSIAIRTISATSNTVRFDNITVATADSDSTSVTLTDVVALDEEKLFWYGIRAIDGTSIDVMGLSADSTTPATGVATYVHPLGTRTAPTIKRSCFATAASVVATTTAAAVGALNYTNIENWPATKTYIGGVNIATDVVDGETWFDGVTGYGYGITQTNSQSSSYSIANVSAIRYYSNFTLMQASMSTVINANSLIPTRMSVILYPAPHTIPIQQSVWSFGTISTGSQAGSYALNLTGSAFNQNDQRNSMLLPLEFNVNNMRVPVTYVIFNAGNCPFIRFTCDNIVNQGTSIYTFGAASNAPAIFVGSYTFNHVLKSSGSSFGLFNDYSFAGVNQPLTININGQYGYISGAGAVSVLGSRGYGSVMIDFGSAGSMVSQSGATSLNDSSAMDAVIQNVRYTGTGTIAPYGAGNAGQLILTNYLNDGKYRHIIGSDGFAAGNDRGWVLQTADTHSGTSAWQYTTGTDGFNPLRVGKVALVSNQQATISVYVKRNNSTFAATMGVYTRVGLLTAVSTLTGAWEMITITYTPQTNEVVEIQVFADNITATDATLIVDDLQVSQA